ncbi:hypothetical protein CO676_24005 [Sinorhizobium sp. BJ1]|nr:hypothetical protein CO676_24005 [Sinorhizobium sp. BJ1]
MLNSCDRAKERRGACAQKGKADLTCNNCREPLLFPKRRGWLPVAADGMLASQEGCVESQEDLEARLRQVTSPIGVKLPRCCERSGQSVGTFLFEGTFANKTPAKV